MSKRKKRKPVYMLNQSDVKDKWSKQLKFLKNEIENFDAGDEDYAVKIATTLRVLFHDTKFSQSLSKSMEVKDKLIFWSSGAPYSPGNLLSTWSLLSLKIANNFGDNQVSYEPLGEDFGEEYLHFLTFEDWWNEIVFSDGNFHFTRKDVICFLANKEGGAHVDLELDELAHITKLNSLGWSDQDGKPPENNPVYASARQIATEVINSIALFFNYKKVRTMPSKKSKVKYIKLNNEKTNFSDKGFYSLVSNMQGETVYSPEDDVNLINGNIESRRWEFQNLKNHDEKTKNIIVISK